MKYKRKEVINNFLFLKKYLAPYKAKIIECILVIGILSLLNLPLPYLNGKCIDLLVLKENGKYYIFLLLLICFLNIIKYLISVNVKLLIGLIGNNIVKDIKLELLSHFVGGCVGWGGGGFILQGPVCCILENEEKDFLKHT